MSDRDNITLPREVVKLALEALDSEHPDIQLRAAIALRTALAAEPTKPEPVVWMDRFGFVFRGKGPYETFTTPLYTTPPDAPTVKESLTHPGYIIGSHWLETAYSRICAGEAEADVLRDIGLVREEAFLTGVAHLKAENEALRRDAERYRWMKQEVKRIPPSWGLIGWDAAIDAAMKEGT